VISLTDSALGWILPAVAAILTLRGFRSNGVASLRWKMYTQISLIVEMDVRDQNGQQLDLSRIKEHRDLWVSVGDIARMLAREEREGQRYTGIIRMLTGYETTTYWVRENRIYESDV
jgi:hypothetical protein